jgi:hypothetical protein
MNKIGTEVLSPAMLMFTDQTAKDEWTSSRRLGWSRVGTQCIQWRCFVCSQCYSILPVLTLDGLITWDTIEGSVTLEWFVQFLRENVVCHLTYVILTCKGNLTDLRRILHLSLAKGNPK